MASLFIVKHMHKLSDEVLCARWIENPCYQYFRDELSFCQRSGATFAPKQIRLIPMALDFPATFSSKTRCQLTDS
ncbi:hypothetical protein ACVIW0_001275 [Bradyrhizobium sp. USDA 4454]